jgi:diaminopimelate epimerase
MKFTKMQGAGNDFIVINNMEAGLSEEQLADLARQLCPRRLAVGADGLMATDRAEKDGDFRMLFFNADGSIGEMCGNGARCIAKYGYDHGLAGEEMTIETTAGPVYASRLGENAYRVRLNDVTKMELDLELDAMGETWKCDYVELGNPPLPHLAVNYPGLKKAETDRLRTLGRALRNNKTLPKGANVNFYDMTEDGRVYERTYERGVEDFTYACGTGTASVAAVLTRRGLADGRGVQISMAGGTLTVDVTTEQEHITGLYLSGPAVTVYEGDTL